MILEVAGDTGVDSLVSLLVVKEGLLLLFQKCSYI